MVIKNIVINPEQTIKESMRFINLNGFRSLIVVDKKNIVLGILTDGDIRRAISKGMDIKESINNIYEKNFFYAKENDLEIKELEKISIENNLPIVPIIDNNKKLVDYYSIYKKNFIEKNKIKTVIMAGGMGARLRPFTNILPKPMLPILNKSMIEHVIDRFIGNGINNFIFSINYKKEIIKPFIKEISKIKKFKYSLIEEKKRLGTAGSLKFLKNMKGNFFLTNCDTIIKGSLTKILNYHKSNNNIITLVASKKEVIIPYGIYKTNNKNIFSKIVEKPKFNYLVNTGFYVLSPRILKIIPTQKKDEIIDMNQIITLAKNKKLKIGIFSIPDKDWIDLGQVESIEKISFDVNQL
jgi:dTDP-glucose pyrophosphorylase